MKNFLALLTLILVVTGLVFLEGKRQPADPDAPLTNLPWQIDILPSGNDTRVFGITLGLTTLDEAVDQLGEVLELALIAAPGETGSLEAYYSHYSAGPVTGRLILVLDIAPELLQTMRTRAVQDGGTRRYYLHKDDLEVAYQAPVRYITFMPSLDLDEEIAQIRFGNPAEVIQVEARQKHLLYPQLGLDLVLDTEGKDLLQYVSPRDFDAHLKRIRLSAAAAE